MGSSRNHHRFIAIDYRFGTGGWATGAQVLDHFQGSSLAPGTDLPCVPGNWRGILSCYARYRVRSRISASMTGVLRNASALESLESEGLIRERSHERLRDLLESGALLRSTGEEHYYSWVEGYVEWLEGKEAREQYYARY